MSVMTESNRVVGNLLKLSVLCVGWLCCLAQVSFGHELQHEDSLSQYFSGQSMNPRSLKSAVTLRPYLQSAFHDVGNLRTIVTNYGFIGQTLDFTTFGGSSLAQYPRKTETSFPTPSILIGALLGRDTLVSGLAEFFPLPKNTQETQGETLQVRSLIDNVFPNLAHSEQDISVVFYDTVTHPNFVAIDFVDQREHRPLGLKIEQTSYAWSLSHADDFIIFDYRITNVGVRQLSKLYLGLWLAGSVSGARITGVDDIVGRLTKPPAFAFGDCGASFNSGFDVVWSADNDGNPNSSKDEFDQFSVTSAIGLRVLRPISQFKKLSYNWWYRGPGEGHQHFGPRKVGTTSRPFRNFGFDDARPFGDRNTYYVMSSGEVDYDQLLSAIDFSSVGWLPPPDSAAKIAMGGVVGSMLSVGPFDLKPGENIPFTFAWVGGENFHTSATNVQDNWDPYNPQPYIDNLDFSELIKNATWAGWVYDNPGFDTDGDGYKGKFHTCVNDAVPVIETTFVVDENAAPSETTFAVDTVSFISVIDTTYFTGDGVPDFRAASPPPAPAMRISPSFGKLVVEWNGLESETTPDIFTNELDFEGYRVYVGLTPRRSDMALISSFDIEDYTQFVFVKRFFGKHPWIVIRKPFSKREIQIAYARGSSRYDPLFNGIDNPLIVGDSTFYFTRQDYNQSDLSDLTAIHKLFPNEPRPHTLDLGKAFTEDTWYKDPLTGKNVFYEGGELTADGKGFKFYEYALTLDNLLPSQPYFVAVTSFDFGSPGSDLGFLETSPTAVAVEALAQDRVDSTIPNGLNVIAYPNPYRVNGNYRAQGFEGRGREDFADERNRLIHFTNLPPECVISVYSLDGDLIRQIIHDKPANDPSAMHDTWDVISRNLQVVVSGIYYFVVETPSGQTQLGKIVVIM